MRAVLCRAYKSPPELHLAEIAPPALASPSSVRVSMRAAGLNFADTLLAAGTYQEKPALPFAPGLEGAGIVTEIGPAVRTIKPGQRVMATFPLGAFAEEAVTEEAEVHAIPDALGFEEAGGFPVAYGTSHVGLTRRAGLKRGETLVVHGAAGGVGLSAVEIGKILGARVIASAGGAEKCALARRHGADETIDYATEDVRARLKTLTAGRGADVIYDPVGGDVFDASVRSLAWEGRLVVVGFASGRIPQAPANILLVKNCAVLGLFWGAYRKENPEVIRQSMAELLDWRARDLLKPHVSLVFDLARANEAFAALRARASTGKIVLTMGR